MPRASATTAASAGQSSCGSSADGLPLLDDARAGRAGRPRSIGRPAAPCRARELVAVARQGDGVEPVVLGPLGPLDPERELDRPPADRLADEPFELGLEGAVGVADLGVELEVAVVDRPDLDADRPAVVLEPGLAESGHAQEQRGLASLEVRE